MQARCKCGNGVFIVMAENETDTHVDLRYECTLCDHEVVFTTDKPDAQAFCDGLAGKFGEEPDDDEVESEPYQYEARCACGHIDGVHILSGACMCCTCPEYRKP